MKNVIYILSVMTLLYACAPSEKKQSTESEAAEWPDRTVLPIEPYQKLGKMEPEIKDSDPIEWPVEISAPKDAPNVLLIMIDDVGYGATETFGGPIPTPNFDKIAKNGLLYNRFHTTAVCSPSRAALITGRNHHTAHTGIIMEFSTPYPGYNSLVPRAVATIGKILTSNGYGTSWFGKNHNVPDWQTTPAGPFYLWPTGLGFEYFYGFLGADAHQFRPALFEDTKPVDPYLDEDDKVNEDYVLDKDLADHAINWIQTQKTVSPNKPFFSYYTPGTAHAPHQAPKEWIAKFKGKFDQGFDKQRQATYEKQKELGIIPKDTKLPPSPPEYQKWDDLSPGMKKVAAREMEVYAAQLAYCDNQIGRIIQSIEDMGELDNTLIIYIMGDNGSSAEDPTGYGMTSEIGMLVNGEKDTEEVMLANLDKFGGPWMAEHYSHSWAHAMNTPYQWDKKIASHLGGSRTGMVISWPKGIKERGIRDQFTHITDITPTILEAANIPQPKKVDGFDQEPMAGKSLVYSFNSPDAPEQHTTQYFEIIANRAIYKDGWMASTTPKILPWSAPNPFYKDPAADFTWELYNLKEDFSQSNDLAKENPEKLKELQDAFTEEAKKYEVFPLDGRYIERVDPKNRPKFNEGRTQFIYHAGNSRITEGMAPNMKNASYSITADVEVKAGDQGMLLTQGGYFAGTAFMLLKGKPTFSYAFSHYPNSKWTIQAPTALKAGKHKLMVNFDYAGGGDGKAAHVTLLVDGAKVAEGEVMRTVPKRFSADETLDVGEDFGTPVTHDYDVPFRFTGKIEKVVIDLK